MKYRIYGALNARPLSAKAASLSKVLFATDDRPQFRRVLKYLGLEWTLALLKAEKANAVAVTMNNVTSPPDDADFSAIGSTRGRTLQRAVTRDRSAYIGLTITVD